MAEEERPDAETETETETNTGAEEQRRGRYRIGAVTRMTGLSAHSLRVWERRYPGLRPERSPAGGRLYSEADVARLKLIARLLERGHAIGAVAGLSTEALQGILDTHHTAPAPPADVSLAHVREAFLSAVGGLQVAQAEQVLGRAVAALPPRQLVDEVLAPVLAEIGRRWEAGELRVAHEHAASAVVRSQAAALLRSGGDAGAPRAVVTTPAGELHEFGALLATIVAIGAGWRAVYLGPNLPAAEIAAAVRESGARAVLVSCVLIDGVEAAGELRRLRDLLPAGVALVAGGRAAAMLVAGVPGVQVVQELAALEALLDALAARH